MTKKLLVLTILCLPLYVIRWKILIFPTTLLEVLIVLSVISWLITQLATKASVPALLRALKTPFLIPSIIFLISGLVAVFISPNTIASLGIYRAYFLEPFILFNLLIITFKSDYRPVLISLLLSGWVVAIPALLQIIGLSYFPTATHELSQGRLAGFYNSANSLALYLGPLVSLAPLYYLGAKRQGKYFAVVTALLFLAVILLTKSLGALLGIAGVALFFLANYLIRNNRHYQKRFFNLILAFAIVIATAFFCFLLNISLFTPKTSSLITRTFSSTETVRLCLWEGTRDLLGSHFVLGTGLNMFPESYQPFRTCDPELLQYPHNVFLNFWVETGLLGLISFILITVIFYKKLTSGSLSVWVKVSLIGFLVYFYVHGIVDVPYFKNDLSAQMWVYLALGWLLMEREKRS